MTPNWRATTPKKDHAKVLKDVSCKKFLKITKKNEGAMSFTSKNNTKGVTLKYFL